MIFRCPRYSFDPTMLYQRTNLRENFNPCATTSPTKFPLSPLRRILSCTEASRRLNQNLSVRENLWMVAVPLSISHSLSHVAVTGLGSALKILRLTHRVFSFTFPHCSAVGFRLSLARWPLLLTNLTNNPTALCATRFSTNRRLSPAAPPPFSDLYILALCNLLPPSNPPVFSLLLRKSPVDFVHAL